MQEFPARVVGFRAGSVLPFGRSPGANGPCAPPAAFGRPFESGQRQFTIRVFETFRSYIGACEPRPLADETPKPDSNSRRSALYTPGGSSPSLVSSGSNTETITKAARRLSMEARFGSYGLRTRRYGIARFNFVRRSAGRLSRVARDLTGAAVINFPACLWCGLATALVPPPNAASFSQSHECRSISKGADPVSQSVLAD